MQSATKSSIRLDRLEYEKVAMEPAAQARQKWQETAAAEGDILIIPGILIIPARGSAANNDVSSKNINYAIKV